MLRPDPIILRKLKHLIRRVLLTTPRLRCPEAIRKVRQLTKEALKKSRGSPGSRKQPQVCSFSLLLVAITRVREDELSSARRSSVSHGYLHASADGAEGPIGTPPTTKFPEHCTF